MNGKQKEIVILFSFKAVVADMKLLSLQELCKGGRNFGNVVLLYRRRFLLIPAILYWSVLPDRKWHGILKRTERCMVRAVC